MKYFTDLQKMIMSASMGGALISQDFKVKKIHHEWQQNQIQFKKHNYIMKDLLANLGPDSKEQLKQQGGVCSMLSVMKLLHQLDPEKQTTISNIVGQDSGPFGSKIKIKGSLISDRSNFKQALDQAHVDYNTYMRWSTSNTLYKLLWAPKPKKGLSCLVDKNHEMGLSEEMMMLDNMLEFAEKRECFNKYHKDLHCTVVSQSEIESYISKGAGVTLSYHLITGNWERYGVHAVAIIADDEPAKNLYEKCIRWVYGDPNRVQVFDCNHTEERKTFHTIYEALAGTEEQMEEDFSKGPMKITTHLYKDVMIIGTCNENNIELSGV